MKRSIAMTIALVLGLSSWLLVADAWARAGGGGASGSRGSRSYSAPRSPSQVSPSRPAMPASPAAPSYASQPPAPQRSWGGMLGGLLVGGLLGSLLFGGMHGLGGGLFGGLGLLELVLIGGLALFAFSWMRRRQAGPREPAYAGAYGAAPGEGGWQSPMASASTATVEAPAEQDDLVRGIAHIRQMDPSFDPAAFGEKATDVFFRIQGAWTSRDMAPVSDLLTTDMRQSMQEQVDRLRAEGKVNRLENIAVRQVQVSEAWQERGQDFVTVYVLASLLDYTTDDSGARVLEGSRNQPVKFEEYWTFTRQVGPNPWRLTAIQQAA